MRKSEQRVPSTSWRIVTPGSCQMLLGLRYLYLLVDEINTDHAEALQLLSRATVDAYGITRWLTERWLGKRGCPKVGY